MKHSHGMSLRVQPWQEPLPLDKESGTQRQCKRVGETLRKTVHLGRVRAWQPELPPSPPSHLPTASAALPLRKAVPDHGQIRPPGTDQENSMACVRGDLAPSPCGVWEEEQLN